MKEHINFSKNVVFLLCILCAYVFAFKHPLNSFAFTALGFLISMIRIEKTD